MAPGRDRAAIVLFLRIRGTFPPRVAWPDRTAE